QSIGGVSTAGSRPGTAGTNTARSTLDTAVNAADTVAGAGAVATTSAVLFAGQSRPHTAAEQLASTAALPGAYLISEVTVVTQAGRGVVGIGLVASCAGRAVPLPPLGAPPGAEHTQTRRFAVRVPAERLVAVHCAHDGAVMERLRFLTTA
ncbi:unnamed protein product, partial [Phaeothamnion confervicola]